MATQSCHWSQVGPTKQKAEPRRESLLQHFKSRAIRLRREHYKHSQPTSGEFMHNTLAAWSHVTGHVAWVDHVTRVM